jgi:hypothetical protein
MNSTANHADNQGIIDLHAAEYTALTTRVTYVDLFSASVWGLIVAFITVVANSWERIGSKGVLVWTGAIAVQLMLIVISSFLGDHYSIVLYLETELHGLVAESGINLEFWSYEKFLARRRPAEASTPWEWTVPIVALLPIPFAVWSLRSRHWPCPRSLQASAGSRWHRWHPWDLVGLILSALALPILVFHSANLIKMRREWTKALNDRKKSSGTPDPTPATTSSAHAGET